MENIDTTISLKKNNGSTIIFSSKNDLTDSMNCQKLALNDRDSLLAFMREVYDARGDSGEDITHLMKLLSGTTRKESDFRQHKELVYAALMGGQISVYAPVITQQQNESGLFDDWIDSASISGQSSGSSNGKKSNPNVAKKKAGTSTNTGPSTNSSTNASNSKPVVSQGAGTNASGTANPPIGETPQNGCPISMITGEELLEHMDVSIPAPLPLQWKRIYRSSQSHLNTGMGFGWRSPYDIELVEADNTIVFVNDEGRRIEFTRPQLKQRSYQLTEALVLLAYDENEFILSLTGNQHWTFKKLGSHWRPTQLNDEFGNHLFLRYNEHNQLARVDASNQRCLIIERDKAANILNVTPGKWDKRSAKCEKLSQALVSYQYDNKGDLIAAIDAENACESYQYENHLFVQRTLKSGYSYHFEWDQFTPQARCIRQWGDDDNYHYQFKYDHANRTTYSTDGRGGKEIFIYNENGRLIDYTDAGGNQTLYEYDQFNRLWSVTNPLGQTEKYQYDAQGRLVETQDVAGNKRLIQYNQQNNPVQYTDATGAVWQRRYDLMGRLTEIINPLGQSVLYHYQRDGKLKKIQHADGTQELFDWNQQGELQNRINSSGRKSQYNYTALGQISQILQPDNRVIHYAYHPSGRIAGIARYYVQPGSEGDVGEIPLDNEQWLFDYDKAGRLIKHTAPGDLITRWEYQGLAQVSRRINPDGSCLEYQYDKERNLTGLINENGEQYQLFYDANEQLIKEIGFDGREQSYQYDPLGQLTEIRDGQFRKQHFKRDALGRIKEKVSLHSEQAESDASVFSYDAEGRLTRANNAARKLKFEYDAAGFLVNEWQDKSLTQHQYDIRGRRIQSKLPDGEVVDYQFNQRGDIERLLLNGNTLAQFERDQQGRELAKTFANGLYAEQHFDPLGRLSEQKLSQTTDKVLMQRSYHYNAAGQIEKIAELAGETQFFYDQVEQLTHVEGLVNAQFNFDPAGNIITLKKPDKDKLQQQGPSSQSNFIGEKKAQIISPQRADSDPKNVRNSARKNSFAGNRLSEYADCLYEYDDSGNLIKIKQTAKQTDKPAEVTQLIYNGANQLIRSRKNKITTEYHYDALGRRVSKNSGTGSTTFLWNGDVLLSEQKHFDRTVYLYEPNSFIPLAQIVNGQVNYLHNDHLGTPIAMSDEQGELNWSVRYQPYGKLDSVQIEQSSSNLRFQGQYFDEETGLHYNRFRYYDPNNGRFTSQDPIGLLGGMNAYRYAPNPVGWVDPLGLKCKEGEAPNKFPLSTSQIDEIRGIPHGQRPNPSEYLSASFIDNHLAQFEGGATRFMTKTNLDKYGIGQRDGTSFVMTRQEADKLLASTNGNARAMEDALGLIENFLDGNQLVRVDIPAPRELNLRIPSGNEAGANDLWIPGGRLPDGNLEAVIDVGNISTKRYLWEPLKF